MHVYVITNRINGKIYVGQHNGDNLARYLADKFYKAAREPRKTPLYAAICKYGKESFRITSLVRPTSFEQMDELEQYYIRILDSQNPKVGYNIFEGGHVGSRGIKLTEEHKRKISEGNRGKKLSVEARRKISESKKNLSPEARRNMSLAQKGKKITTEHEAALHAGFKNMSEESRLRMENGYKKSTYIRTPEHCRKIAEALRGKKASAETKAKLSALRAGRKLSAEHSAAIKKGINEKVSKERRSEIARLRNQIRWHGKPSV